MPFRVLHDYPRRQHLEFFRRSPSPFYSISFELDATNVRAQAKTRGASIYAALVWCFHHAMLGIDAFRTRLHGEDVVLYDSLNVGMTVPAPERTFSFANFEWRPEADDFFVAAREAMATASAAADLAGGKTPDYAYYTALPRVPFTSFVHVALPDPTAGQPETAFGQIRDVDGRAQVPVGILVNHLYVDGADLGDLYDAARASFDRAF